MAVNELLKAVRSGGPQARDAATSLLENAQAGALKPQEIAEAKKLLATPELKDVFKDGLGASLRDALGRGASPVREVKALLPNPFSLDPRSLAQRFGADLLLMRQQLVDQRLSNAENADRLMEFFAAYAKRFVELSHPRASLPSAPVTPIPPEDQAKLLRQFEKVLTDGGFRELFDHTTGLDGLASARSLLTSKSLDEVTAKMRTFDLDGPGLSDPRNLNATAIALSAEHERLAKRKREEAASAKRTRAGRLGSNMLWNALHLIREGAETPEEKEALNKLIVTAGLLLVFVAVMVTIFLLTI
jgi:hypothetical protein